MSIAAIIVGIDGWEKYTEPLIRSIEKHEPDCDYFVIDNLSTKPYPHIDGVFPCPERMCYSKAINLGHFLFQERGNPPYDWYIVLSNDVLCTGPFAHMLEAYGDGDVVGPLLKQVHGFDYLEGWCVAIPRQVWDAVGGWDERFLGSDYEDVAFSTAARRKGFGLVGDPNLPFAHLDQRQRYTIVEDFAGKNAHNRDLFLREYARVTA